MSSHFPDLIDGEVELNANDDCLVFRHVHPKACDGDKIESWAFAPNSGDQGKMSVTQSSQVNPSEAFDEYTASHESAGMWGLTTTEIAAAGTRTVNDQVVNPGLPSGHAFVDFRDLVSKRQITKRARKLRDKAIDRGRQFPA